MDFPHPAPGFDDPIGVLRACHERIIRHAGLLDAALRGEVPFAAAAMQVHRYFSTAGVQHHEDEECDLFPLIQDRGAAQLIAALAQEHRRLERLWQAVAPALRDGAADARQRSAGIEFAATNIGHVTRENEALLPLAGRVLEHPEIQAVGRAMARRRGLPDPWGGAPSPL